MVSAQGMKEMGESLRTAQVLEELGAVVRGKHFVYESRKHGPDYVDKSVLFTWPRRANELCGLLSDRMLMHQVDVVVGPALGGIALAQYVAYNHSLRTDDGTRAVFAEKDPKGKGFVFTRGYDKLIRGQRVAVVEDILNTGGSAREVVELVRRTGGKVVAIGALVNRGGVTSMDICGEDMAPLHVLLSIPFPSYLEAECPLCAQGVPVETILGRGARFLAEKAARK